MDRHLISFAFGIIRNVPAPHPLGCMFVYLRHGHRARLVCRDRPVGCRRAGGAHQQPGRLCGHRGGGRHGAGGHPGPSHGQPLCRIRAAHQRSPGQNQWSRLKRGNASVAAGGELGRLHPQVLANGLYDIALIVRDTAGKDKEASAPASALPSAASKRPPPCTLPLKT